MGNCCSRRTDSVSPTPTLTATHEQQQGQESYHHQHRHHRSLSRSSASDQHSRNHHHDIKKYANSSALPVNGYTWAGEEAVTFASSPPPSPLVMSPNKWTRAESVSVGINLQGATFNFSWTRSEDRKPEVSEETEQNIELSKSYSISSTRIESTDKTTQRYSHRLAVSALICGYDDAGTTLLNEHIVLGHLGHQASFGRCRIGVDTRYQRVVCVKPLKRMPHRRAIGVLAKQREYFSNLFALKHPNLVQITSVVDDPAAGRLYIFSEFCSHGSLAQYESQRFDVESFRTMLSSVLGGLDYLHRSHAVHMDVRPENILVTKSTTTNQVGDDDVLYKLSDYGLRDVLDMSFDSKRRELDETLSPSLVGQHTAHYEAPERLELVLREDEQAESQSPPQEGVLKTKGNSALTPETDMWSLGVTLFVVVYGSQPFTGHTVPRLYRSILCDEVFVPDVTFRGGGVAVGVPRELRDIISMCLERDPKKRLTLTGALNSDFFCFSNNNTTN
eukprot:PhM_4_TR3158/c0_g1_i1/m.14162/K07198/PRKAA, AMPK; 5'-AMP-activated protein kinase, catalytic alpha subunit